MASTDRGAFKRWLSKSPSITILTGAGISAESGVPTFRGAGGLWRTYAATDLATPEAWRRDPGLVWEFYDYRRQIMKGKQPNDGHRAIATLEARWRTAGRSARVVTQNIDGLHAESGSRDVTCMHGSLWKVRCTECGDITENDDVPITSAFEGCGSPDPDAHARRFTEADLPHCGECGGVLRPHVVWFGESLNPADLEGATHAATHCATLLVVGTSAVVYPAAGLIPMARARGIVVAEVNLETTPATGECDFVFQGKSGEVLPELLDVEPTE